MTLVKMAANVHLPVKPHSGDLDPSWSVNTGRVKARQSPPHLFIIYKSVRVGCNRFSAFFLLHFTEVMADTNQGNNQFLA